MKKILFLSFFLLLSSVFLFKATFAAAQSCNPGSYYPQTTSGTAKSYLNTSTSVCTASNYTSYFTAPAVTTTSAQNGTSVKVQPCTYDYYSSSNCSGSPIGYGLCTSETVSCAAATATPTKAPTPTPTSSAACTNGATKCVGTSTANSYDNHAYYQQCVSGAWSNVNCPSNEYCYWSGSTASCVGGCTQHSGVACSSSCTTGAVPSGTNGYYCASGTCCSTTAATPTPTPTTTLVCSNCYKCSGSTCEGPFTVNGTCASNGYIDNSNCNGTCSTTCNPSNPCIGLTCGSLWNGCSYQSCGTCPGNESCLNNQCVAVTAPPAGCNVTYTPSTNPYIWTVPAGITSVTFDAYGAAGSGGSTSVGAYPGTGGLGGEARATFSVTPGQSFGLQIVAAPTVPNTGGYFAEVDLGSYAYVSAGGGGGGGSSNISGVTGGNGGAGGGTSGEGATSPGWGNSCTGGGAGTTTAGGAAGAGNPGSGSYGAQPGTAGYAPLSQNRGNAGGAGAGIQIGGSGGDGAGSGGGGGEFYYLSQEAGCGGGGASNNFGPGATNIVSASGVNSGNGKITVTCNTPTPTPVSGGTTYTISGNVFIDTPDKDGILNNGEQNYKAVLNLSICANSPSCANPIQAQTAADGTYSVPGLPAGTYVVSLLTVPSGYEPTEPKGTPPSWTVTVGPNCNTEAAGAYGAACE